MFLDGIKRYSYLVQETHPLKKNDFSRGSGKDEWVGMGNPSQTSLVPRGPEDVRWLEEERKPQKDLDPKKRPPHELDPMEPERCEVE